MSYEFQEIKAVVSKGVNDLQGAVTEALGHRDRAISTVQQRVADVEQKLARRGGGAVVQGKSWGQALVESDEYKALATSPSQRGKAKAAVSLETKTILSASSTWGSGVSPSSSLVVADRQPLVPLPMRPLVIADLLGKGVTTSNNIEFPVQASFTNNAAVVAENTLKPVSDLGTDLKSVPVRTLAHTMKASRQILDDAPQLQSFIDSQMRYGLELAEETEILNGDGTGQHMLGIIPQASTYSGAFTVPGETNIDRLALGLLQAELTLVRPEGVVVHPSDFRRIILTKDAQGRYVVGDPLGQDFIPVLWSVPIVSSLSIPAGTFLLGPFRTGAQLFSRMEAEVLISTEDQDNFVKNMVTIRAEERMALAVYRPASFITGSFL